MAHRVADLQQLVAFAGLGQNHRCRGAGVVAAALLTSSITGPAILWACSSGFSGIQLERRRDPQAGALMESLLASLLDDFDHWFHRGQELLERCPDDVLECEEREALRGRLDQGLKAVAATRALDPRGHSRWRCRWRP